MLNLAVRDKLIPSNPYLVLTADDRPDPAESRRHVYEWTREEIDALIAAAEARAAKRGAQQDYAFLIRFAVRTGLRLGECLGLQWHDVDFDDRVLHVRRQWTKLGAYDLPKTKSSVRRVPLEPELVRALRERRLASPFSKDENVVFASRRGTNLSHRNVQRRGWAPARDAAGLPPTLRFRDLRHAFASFAASRGIPVGVLSAIMGHSDEGVTQRVYIHLYDRPKVEDAFRAAMADGGKWA